MEGAKKDKAGSKLSVERVYQKKTQLEHILLRPDTYIGTVEPITQVSAEQMTFLVCTLSLKTKLQHIFVFAYNINIISWTNILK